MGRPVDPETKGKALADLATGMGVRAVARTYGLSQGTVSKWAAGVRTSVSTVVETMETIKKMSLPELCAEYLHASLEAQIAQARLFADPEWLHKQSAHDLAVLHGIHNDKVVRLLYAFRPAKEESAA